MSWARVNDTDDPAATVTVVGTFRVTYAIGFGVGVASRGLLSVDRAAANAVTPLGGVPESCSESSTAALVEASVPLKVTPLLESAGKPTAEVVEVSTPEVPLLGVYVGTLLLPLEHAAIMAAAPATISSRRLGETAKTRKAAPFAKATTG